MSTLKTIKDFDLEGKKVFIRADLNVPIKNGQVANNHRIMNALPTIRYALDQKAKVILASHLGRPQGVDPSLSLAPVGAVLSEVLDVDIFFAEELLSDVPKVIAPSLRQNQMILLENLRFHKGEASNDKKLAQQIAKHVDIYINDAFGVCHRNHMSLSALPQMVDEKGIGFLIQNELKMLNQIRDNPKRPFVLALGGSKVKDKFEMILKMIEHVDHFIIGGAMSYVFLKAQGYDLGATKIEHESVTLARELIERIKLKGKTLHLPLDHVIVPDVRRIDLIEMTKDISVKDSWLAVDIGERTRESFNKVLKQAETIFWNGPMGIFEIPEYSEGTRSLIQGIGDCSKAFRVAGGGDSARAVFHFQLQDHLDYISTGGGASLAYIYGRSLPGLEPIERSVPNVEPIEETVEDL